MAATKKWARAILLVVTLALFVPVLRQLTLEKPTEPETAYSVATAYVKEHLPFDPVQTSIHFLPKAHDAVEEMVGDTTNPGQHRKAYRKPFYVYSVSGKLRVERGHPVRRFRNLFDVPGGRPPSTVRWHVQVRQEDDGTWKALSGTIGKRSL